MAYQFITYRVADRIAYVTINRPEVMNALHAEASAEMRDAFERFRSDDEAWVAIVTGAGDRAFSAGNDLRATAERAADRSAARPAAVPLGGITSDFECDKPLIAAVNGYALGGGFELALACDVIVAADSARFGLPEPRVGLVAGAGGMHRLPRHVPLKIAMGMMLTGRQIGAQEAAGLGIVNEVVPLGDLMAAAERWAADMLACSPVSLRITKQCVLAGLASPVEVAMEADRTSGRLSVLRNSEDAREGPLAFAQKRPPQWRGL
ncbi:MAG TPA: enoyl-CoA hydratase-related protein [Streptosporangiaceae bacterium]|jgi:enoyl-CoA hydratase/carnithine racemase|nr:enoyl-CoA hydratase-related protein [Streptosporangiaceae bacterium]